MAISPISVPNGSGNIAASVGEIRPAISTDFETFLKMLTVQMQNQDPLNPIDSSDYAVQLATFSSVEQQVKTNDLLASLARKMDLMGLSQYASWIGMEARVVAPAYFDGAPISLHADLENSADAAFLVVQNDAGQEVSRHPVDPPGGPLEWAGIGADGQPVPAGQYQFKLEGFTQGRLIETVAAQVYAPIIEAKSQNGEMMIVLRGGVEVVADEITAIRSMTEE